MIGDIQAYNAQLLREETKRRGGRPIPMSIRRAWLAEAGHIGELADRGVSIPFVGRERVKGFQFEGELFVDTSGFGSDGESALSGRQTVERMRELVAEFGNRTLFWGLTTVGQFQAYLGYWTLTRERAGYGIEEQ